MKWIGEITVLTYEISQSGKGWLSSVHGVQKEGIIWFMSNKVDKFWENLGQS